MHPVAEPAQERALLQANDPAAPLAAGFEQQLLQVRKRQVPSL